MNVTVRDTIPLIIVAVLGFGVLFAYPLDIPVLTTTVSGINTWVTVITSFAMGIGVVNMLIIHQRRIATKDKRWPYSAALIISLLAVLALGLFSGMTSSVYEYMYDIFISAGRLSLVSLRGFAMFTAFYYAYRVRSWDGSIMLICTLLVMTYQVPLQGLISPYLPKFTTWLLDVPTVAGNRGIYMIAGICLIIMSIRMLAGLDRSWLGRVE